MDNATSIASRNPVSEFFHRIFTISATLWSLKISLNTCNIQFIPFDTVLKSELSLKLTSTYANSQRIDTLEDGRECVLNNLLEIDFRLLCAQLSRLGLVMAALNGFIPVFPNDKSCLLTADRTTVLASSPCVLVAGPSGYC